MTICSWSCFHLTTLLVALGNRIGAKINAQSLQDSRVVQIRLSPVHEFMGKYLRTKLFAFLLGPSTVIGQTLEFFANRNCGLLLELRESVEVAVVFFFMW